MVHSKILSIKIVDDFQRLPNKIIFESGLTYVAMDQIIKQNDGKLST